jgi:AcrR family transcriptional regulator
MPRISHQRAQRQRRRIIDAASRCFAERGFHNTTMRDVFEASGLTAGAVYGYFARKQDIIVAVVEERHAIERDLLARVKRADDPLASFVDGYFGAFLTKNSTELRHLTIEFWAELLRDDSLQQLGREGLRALTDATRLLGEAQSRGLVRDDVEPETLSRLILAALNGLLLQSTWQPDKLAGAIEKCKAGLVSILKPVANKRERRRPTRSRAPK